MDKVKKYKVLVKKLLGELAAEFKNNSDWEILESYDELRGQFALFSDSWTGSHRDYGCVMHIEVKDNGKIYLRRDGTDLDIGQQLLDEGVPKSDMVIGFHSPAMRAMTDFAQS